MGNRCRFVQPGIVRLPLVDVHRRAHADLIAKSADPKVKTKDKPTPAQIADAASRVAQAEQDADFIDIKRELNAGEQRKLFTDLVKQMHPGEKVELKPELVGMTKVVAYLLDWSFLDNEGRPVPVSEAAINNLDTETFQEITKAIDAHEEAQEAKRAEEKNDRVGRTSSEVI